MQNFVIHTDFPGLERAARGKVRNDRKPTDGDKTSPPRPLPGETVANTGEKDLEALICLNGNGSV